MKLIEDQIRAIPPINYLIIVITSVFYNILCLTSATDSHVASSAPTGDLAFGHWRVATVFIKALQALYYNTCSKNRARLISKD
ncbi:unnamed protein product [Leptidea sinapis]|uniref:Uncharacterized protein n=1 Tax=Leptidea sinapis TaxID=189913 RepID=A0A5E4Q3N0_9NEOP|nr:unnamed protein product [Leptidea sinapis]